MAILTSSCSGAAEETVAVTTAPVQPSTTVATTTTTVPDLGDVLLATLSDPDFAAAGTINGGFDILGTAIPFIGEMGGSADQGRLLFTFEPPLAETTEGILIDGEVYERTDGGPWIEADPNDDDWLWNYLPDIGALTQIDDVTIDEITYPAYAADIDIPIAALGLYDFMESVETSDIVFLSDQDGAPQGLVLTASGVRDELAYEVTMNLLYESSPAPDLAIPEDYLIRFESVNAVPYTLGIPEDWEAESDGKFSLDSFYFDTSELQVYTYAEGPVLLTDWSEFEQDFVVTEADATIISSAIEEIEGREWATFAYSYEDADFGPTFGIYAVTMAGEGAIEMYFYADAGYEAADAALFFSVISTIDTE